MGLCNHNINNNAETYALLRNGIKMPIFGLGTSHSGGYSHAAVLTALRDGGYRLIDTAKRYGCEELLGQDIKASGIPRDELFIITKLWPSEYGFDSSLASFKGSLHRLNVDYIDLYMLHYPVSLPSETSTKEQILEETWRRLEMLYDDGLCLSIGVSNYGKSDLEAMLDTCSVVPHVNQVEFHPYQNPQQLHRFCQQNGIQLQGYCPLGKGHLLKEPPILEVAKQCNRTPAQVLIRWSIQNGVVTIPKSTNPARILENSKVFDFSLPFEAMNLLNSLHDGRRYIETSSIYHKLSLNLPDGYKLKLLD